MITNSKQNWEVGSKVKVGFMILTVKRMVATPGDFAPDAYILQSSKGKVYRFVPHNGLELLYGNEAKQYMQPAYQNV